MVLAFWIVVAYVAIVYFGTWAVQIAIWLIQAAAWVVMGLIFVIALPFAALDAATRRRRGA